MVVSLQDAFPTNGTVVTSRRFAKFARNAHFEQHILKAVLIDKDRRRTWRREPAHRVVEDCVDD